MHFLHRTLFVVVLFASAALVARLSYRQLLQRIVSLALARPVRPQ